MPPSSRPADIPVVILCGGLGTRLREETDTRPKPMVEIGSAPILWHIMKIYSHHGFRRFVLCLGYKGHVIKDFFRHFSTWRRDLTIELSDDGGVVHRESAPREDWSITLAETGDLTMTGGRIHRIEKYIDGDTFMATYGDGVANIDLTRELAFHRGHGRIATVAAMNPRSRFGMLEIAEDGFVESFREKPLMDDWVNGGFYAFDKAIFDYLEEDCVLEHEPLERLAKDAQLMAYRHVGVWETMDTYRDYQFLNGLWSEGRAGWKVWAD